MNVMGLPWAERVRRLVPAAEAFKRTQGEGFAGLAVALKSFHRAAHIVRLVRNFHEERGAHMYGGKGGLYFLSAPQN